jgi:hypothetical protein
MGRNLVNTLHWGLGLLLQNWGGLPLQDWPGSFGGPRKATPTAQSAGGQLSMEEDDGWKLGEPDLRAATNRTNPEAFIGLNTWQPRDPSN